MNIYTRGAVIRRIEEIDAQMDVLADERSALAHELGQEIPAINLDQPDGRTITVKAKPDRRRKAYKLSEETRAKMSKSARKRERLKKKKRKREE